MFYQLRRYRIVNQKDKNKLRPSLQELEKIRKQQGEFVSNMHILDRIITLTREESSISDLLETLCSWRNKLFGDKCTMDKEKAEIIRRYKELQDI